MAGYIGPAPVPQATQNREAFTATGGQTTFATSGYKPGYLDVYLNGVKLAAADYTATNGSDVVLASGAAASDILEIVAFQEFTVADQTFTGDITFTGASYDAVWDASDNALEFGDNAKATFGASADLQIYHDGTSNIFAGNIVIDGSDTSASIASLAALNIKAGDANNEYSTLRLATSADGSLAMIGAKAITTGAYPNSVGQLELAVQNGTSTNTVLTVTTTSLGIGTSSPSEKLTIQSGNLNFMGGTNDAQYIKFGDTSDDDIGNIFYYHGNNNMVFTTNASEAMRIDSSGNLLVGKTAASSTTVGAELRATGQAILVADGTNPILMNRQTSDGDIAVFRKDGTTVGSIGSAGSGIRPYFAGNNVGLSPYNGVVYPTNGSGTAVNNSVDLGASGYAFQDLYLSGGVYLGGTGAANKLDDYEEGTYSYTITGTTSGSATPRAGYDSLQYTKVGRLVTVTGRWETTGGHTLSGNVVFSLPFAINASLDDQAETGVGIITLLRSGTAFNQGICFAAVGFPGESQFYIYYQSDGTGNESLVQGSQLDSAFEGHIQFQYVT